MNNGFSTLNISAELIHILSHNRITEPTLIQHQAIPVLLKGKDAIAQAQTGTGKTLAFLLPIMQKIKPSDDFVQALIITPTRELALQITLIAKMLAQAGGVNILAAYGGQDFNLQKKKLKKSVHIVIGTPGRLLDHINRKSVNFTRIKTLVLDEADQMLDMGFQRDVEQIIHNTARNRQTVLCSATMPRGIAALAEKYLTSPSRIHAAGKTVTLANIRQIAVETTDKNKHEILCSLIDEYKPFLAIIFCRTKRRAQSLNKLLNIRRYKSDELHGNLTQGQREKAMKAFRESKIQFLVATDIAARGLDVEGITHIFNFDLPANAENYIHRIGRTGRAGHEGSAITFFTQAERKDLAFIERGIKSTLDIIPGNRVNSGYITSQDDISAGKTVNRNTAKKLYSSKAEGRTDRSTGKFSSERRHFPKNSDSRRDEFSGRKKDLSGKKITDINSIEKNYTGKDNYKYSDRKSFTHKPFFHESENTSMNDYGRGRNYSDSNTSRPVSTRNRMAKDSIYSLLKENIKKSLSAQKADGRASDV
jgi:ATP-dependent RNA helicase DeaD